MLHYRASFLRREHPDTGRQEGSHSGKFPWEGFLPPPSESCCMRSCGFGVCHHISSFPCSNLPTPRRSPQASGLSAGSGFSAKSGCLERNIVQNRGLRKVLIFRCLSNLSKKCFPSASSALWCSTARGASWVSSWGRKAFLNPGPTYLAPPDTQARGSAWFGGPSSLIAQPDHFCHCHCLNSHRKIYAAEQLLF